MTKKELVARIARETGHTYEMAFDVVQKVLDYMTEALADGETIEFRDFGVFEIKTRKPRIGRNPNMPEKSLKIPPRKIVKFKPGKKMRELVAQIPVNGTR